MPIARRQLDVEQTLALQDSNVTRSIFRDGSEMIEIGIDGGHVLSASLPLGATSFTFGNLSSPEHMDRDTILAIADAMRALAVLTEIR